MNRSKLNTNLKELLALSNISQSTLAKTLNVKHSTVCGWCSGEREPSLYYVGLICVALQCEPNDLLGDYLEGWTETVQNSYNLPESESVTYNN